MHHPEKDLMVSEQRTVESDTEEETGESCRVPPIPSFYFGYVPVYEDQDPFQYYHFTSVAGRGGYATVYNVEHLESGERFACKIVHARDSGERVKRALKEACMQSILSEHPNVTTLKEVWTFGLKHVFLVMEKCDGGEVFDAIVSRGALPENDAASVMRVVLQLIKASLEKGILNHDIKPENLMLKDKERGLEKSNIRALDFGCSSFIDEPLQKLSGTPLYAAPEIIKGLYHDHRADLWSAGVVLFCMLTGLMPFEGHENQDIKHAVLTQTIDFEEDPWPFVSPNAKDLCKRLLKREASERISLDDALSHPWLKENLLDISEEYLQNILSRLQEFPLVSPTQRLLLLVYACKYGEETEDYKICSSVFDWLDRDGNGKLKFRDLHNGLTGFDIQLSEKRLEELFFALSQTDKGSISFKEFQAAVLDRFWLDDFSTVNQLLENVSLPNENPAFLSVDSVHSQLVSLGLEIRKDALEEMTDCHDSMGNACFSRSNLEDAWNDMRHAKAGSHNSGDVPSDPVNVELSNIWKDASEKNGSHHSIAGSSPLRGGSPNTESSWDRMMLVRGSSPATVGYAGSENDYRNSPPTHSSLTWDGGQQISQKTDNGEKLEERLSKEGFCSGGVMYWDGFETFDERQELEEDSDDLFGPALVAFKANHA